MKWTGILMVSLAVAAAAGPQNSDPRLTQTQVLFQVGGPVHDSESLPSLLKQVLERTGRYTVTISQDRDLFKVENIKSYNIVLIYTTGGALSEDQEKGLVEFVESGNGLVGIHSATDSFKNSDAYWKLLCGRFIGHGAGEFRVKITGRSHSIVKGFEDFIIKDETYFHRFHPESKPIVLMRREEDGEPASWVHYYGKGRVFVTGLGHGREAWENPAFQKMIIRAMDWASGRLNP